MQPSPARSALAAAIALVCGIATTSRAGAAGDDPALARLQATAKTRQLAEDRQWHALLHYRPNRFGGGVTSLADQPDFFLAPGGKVERAKVLSTPEDYSQGIASGIEATLAAGSLRPWP